MLAHMHYLILAVRLHKLMSLEPSCVAKYKSTEWSILLYDPGLVGTCRKLDNPGLTDLGLETMISWVNQWRATATNGHFCIRLLIPVITDVQGLAPGAGRDLQGIYNETHVCCTSKGEACMVLHKKYNRIQAQYSGIYFADVNSKCNFEQ